MDPNKSEKSDITQPQPPPYQDLPTYPNTGYPQPRIYPSLPAYPGQPIPPAQYGQAPYPGQPPITVQPMVYVTQTPLARPMPDYLCFSIFTMLCCCLPLGIAALVYSISTRHANDSGQQNKAEKNSRTSRNLNIAALVIGLIFVVVYIIVIVISVMGYKRN